MEIWRWTAIVLAVCLGVALERWRTWRRNAERWQEIAAEWKAEALRAPWFNAGDFPHCKNCQRKATDAADGAAGGRRILSLPRN